MTAAGDTRPEEHIHRALQPSKPGFICADVLVKTQLTPRPDDSEQFRQRLGRIVDRAKNQRDNGRVEGGILRGKPFGNIVGDNYRDGRCLGSLNGKGSQAGFGLHGKQLGDSGGVKGEVEPVASAYLNHASGKPRKQFPPMVSLPPGQRSIAQSCEHPGKDWMTHGTAPLSHRITSSAE